MSEFDDQEFGEEADEHVEMPDNAAIDAIQVEGDDSNLDEFIVLDDEAFGDEILDDEEVGDADDVDAPKEKAATDEDSKRPSWLIPLAAILGLIALIGALVFGLFYFVDDFSFPGFGSSDFGDAARVNKGSVSKKRLNAEMTRLELSQPGIFDEANGGIDKDMVRSQKLDELINQELLLQKAKDEGISVTDEDIQSEFDALKAQFGDEFKTVLKDAGYTESELRESIMYQLMLTGLLDSLVPRDSITDAQVKAYYDDNAESFTEPAGKQISHILFDPEDKDKAEETLALLKSGGGDFAALATELSKDTGSAASGGDLGWGSSDTYVPEFKEAVDQLDKDELSELVQTQFGWHIIKVTDTREEGTVDFDKVKDDIKNMIYNQEMSTKYQDLITVLREDADIEILDAAVIAYRKSQEETPAEQ